MSYTEELVWSLLNGVLWGPRPPRSALEAGYPREVWGLTTVSLSPPAATKILRGDGSAQKHWIRRLQALPGLSWPGRGTHQVPITNPGAKACRTHSYPRPFFTLPVPASRTLPPTLPPGWGLPPTPGLPALLKAQISKCKSPVSPLPPLPLPHLLPSHPHPDISPPHPPFLSLPPPLGLTGPPFSCLYSGSLNEKVVHWYLRLCYLCQS